MTIAKCLRISRNKDWHSQQLDKVHFQYYGLHDEKEIKSVHPSRGAAENRSAAEEKKWKF